MSRLQPIRLALLDVLCTVLLALGSLAVPVVALGCGGDGEGEDVPVESAELKLQLRRDDGTASLVDYDVSIRWRGEVVNETGSVGATSFDVTKEYSGKTDLNGDWTADQLFLQRRAGTWRITVDADGFVHTCEVELEKDTLNIVSLTWGKSTCLKGPNFP